MRKLLIIAALAFGSALAPGLAMANCTTHTYTVNGRMMTCTTCCYFGNCNTTCF
jgi:hypothetical protein